MCHAGRRYGSCAVVVPNAALQLALDLVGIFVFALTGAMVAVRKDMDVFGVLVLATATGLGGGITRDVLIGDLPPAAFEDWRVLAVPVAAGLLLAMLHNRLDRASRRRLDRARNAVLVLDGAGLATFCVTGTTKALAFGLGPLPAALLGVLTAVGGGVVRDVLAGEIPLVLRRELYAVPALAGAAVVVAGHELGMRGPVVPVAAAAVAFGYRMLAVWRNWNAPRPGGRG